MQTITLSAHYNGQQILLDEPYELAPDTRLMITVLPKPLSERSEWLHFAAQNLAEAYDDDEPEYTLADVKEMNPDYDGS